MCILIIIIDFYRESIRMLFFKDRILWNRRFELLCSFIILITIQIIRFILEWIFDLFWFLNRFIYTMGLFRFLVNIWNIFEFMIKTTINFILIDFICIFKHRYNLRKILYILVFLSYNNKNTFDFIKSKIFYLLFL